MDSVLPDALFIRKGSDNLLFAVRVLREAVILKMLEEESSGLRITEIDESISTILRLLASASEVWEVEEVIFSGELADLLSQFVLFQTARKVLNHHCCLVHVDRLQGFTRTHRVASGIIAEASQQYRGGD
jgi:hypothetical protein